MEKQVVAELLSQLDEIREWNRSIRSTIVIIGVLESNRKPRLSVVLISHLLFVSVL